MDEKLQRYVPGLAAYEVTRLGRRLRGMTAGQGVPPIVLVSGAGESALDWLPIMPATAALSTVVAVDRAGLGASDPDTHLEIQSQVDDLAAVLAVTGPAVVVGHSWGGHLAQLVAWQHPESIEGLVLVDPSHEELTAALSLRLRIASAAIGPAIVGMRLTGLFPRVARSMARRLAALCAQEPGVRAAIEDAYMRSYRHRHQVSMIGRENRLLDRNLDLVRRARSHGKAPNVPAAVLAATRGKPKALQEKATSLYADVAAALPRGRLILVEDSGHYVHHDRPAVVVDAIAAVLAEIRDGVVVPPDSR